MAVLASPISKLRSVLTEVILPSRALVINELAAVELLILLSTSALMLLVAAKMLLSVYACPANLIAVPSEASRTALPPIWVHRASRCSMSVVRSGSNCDRVMYPTRSSILMGPTLPYTPLLITTVASPSVAVTCMGLASMMVTSPDCSIIEIWGVPVSIETGSVVSCIVTAIVSSLILFVLRKLTPCHKGVYLLLQESHRSLTPDRRYLNQK